MFASMNGIAVTAPAASTPGRAAMRPSASSKNPRSRSGPGLRSQANICSTATPPRENPASRLTRLTKLLQQQRRPRHQHQRQRHFGSDQRRAHPAMTTVAGAGPCRAAAESAQPQRRHDPGQRRHHHAQPGGEGGRPPVEMQRSTHSTSRGPSAARSGSRPPPGRAPQRPPARPAAGSRRAAARSAASGWRRGRCARPAPCIRAAPRASSRFVTFTQAMSSTTATAAANRQTAGRTSPTRCSRMVTTSTRLPRLVRGCSTFDLRRHSVHLGPGLRDRHAGLQPADDVPVAAGADARLVLLDRTSAPRRRSPGRDSWKCGKKSSGITPAISHGSPSMVTRRPTTDGSAANRDRHTLAPMTTTRWRPRL